MGAYATAASLLERPDAGKINAAVDARMDPDFVLIARTDALESVDWDKPIRRGPDRTDRLHLGLPSHGGLRRAADAGDRRPPIGSPFRLTRALPGELGDRACLDGSLANDKKAHESLDVLAVGTPGRKPILPQYPTRLLNDHAATDAAFTCDVGTQTIWAARHLTMNGHRRLIASLAHRSMAGARPAGHRRPGELPAPPDGVGVRR